MGLEIIRSDTDEEIWQSSYGSYSSFIQGVERLIIEKYIEPKYRYVDEPVRDLTDALGKYPELAYIIKKELALLQKDSWQRQMQRMGQILNSDLAPEYVPDFILDGLKGLNEYVKDPTHYYGEGWSPATCLLIARMFRDVDAAQSDGRATALMEGLVSCGEAGAIAWHC